MAPYVRQAARRQMRYSPQNPPPKDPPPELRLPNPGLWRVWYYVWHAHQPDQTGRLCRRCRR
ncbi:MAG: hypothetical protein GEU94_21025, partial [Micromonosporaceae bacterium]|nr:hypothetical protein [Micromonosporaceae bacterium]